jgi:ABC-2 type transport system ATP-binding protein
VVFLDELTTGLDPTARRATWELVAQVRDRGATVVLVTHFMEEAEALCDRIAVVDRGRVVACETPAALTTRHGGPIRITFTASGAARSDYPGAGFDPRQLLELSGVDAVTVAGGQATVIGNSGTAVAVAAALAEHGITPLDFRTHYPSLEDVFLTLTGRRLNKGDPA